MNALANIGDLVKATEFIGQSSGLWFYSLSYLLYSSKKGTAAFCYHPPSF